MHPTTPTRPAGVIMASLLAADIGALAEAARAMERAGADGLHIDIMDGNFVPNLSMGPEVVRGARRWVRLPLNVHLMLSRPGDHVERFLEAGAHRLSVHVEAEGDLHAILARIRAHGVSPGITLNPETPAAMVRPYLAEVDEVLCMTVHPGFGGQAFIPEAAAKLTELRAWAPGLDLAVDGGLNERTVAQTAALGANVFYVGSDLFRAPDPQARILELRAAVSRAATRGGGRPDSA